MTVESARGRTRSRAERVAGKIEPRWPIALALGSFIALTIVLRVVQPQRESLGPPWLVPGIEIALLLALLAANPAAAEPAEALAATLSIGLLLPSWSSRWSPRRS